MKKTVKTSRVAGQLEKMYRLLNARFFNGELPEVVISLKKTVGAYGHFTCSKVWQAGDERRYEINISSATLSRAIEDTCSTLLHEMCHCFAAEKGIKDTSGSGNFYHNRKYKYGRRGARQAQELLAEVTGLFAGGEMADEDMREMVDAIQEAYLIAKKNNKKYTPKKYRKDE